MNPVVKRNVGGSVALRQMPESGEIADHVLELVLKLGDPLGLVEPLRQKLSDSL